MLYYQNTVNKRWISTSLSSMVRFGSGGKLPPSSTSDNGLKLLGKLMGTLKSGTYKSGQLFIHKIFGYRGVIFRNFETKLYGARGGTDITKHKIIPSYQVFIHREDWKSMRMPTTLTAYLDGNDDKREKALSHILGMDLVMHGDVIPYMPLSNVKPIEHDLFERLFSIEKSSKTDGFVYTMNKQGKASYDNAPNTFIHPQCAYQTTENNIQMTITIFYLGKSITSSNENHCWRYVIRVHNLDETNCVFLSETRLKLFSMNNTSEKSIKGDTHVKNPYLTKENPCLQYSSVIELPYPKGSHMWGTLLFENFNDKSKFNIQIPTVKLEAIKTDEILELESGDFTDNNTTPKE
ncbi:ApaG domain and Hemimethylated DNA-binding domain-containing protein [Strongyloides ratti]|uniref:ApaG domain and Hemimethylated DNA-binding domain-containing protein n=1 Tax=Strongyloides ratti TaxID=34506 RepID=A0A090L4V1_STRRB|nr:ApaG domain and Hemimethylated DNA-binding domain-containing protein [Strongyloides ratti]CEF64722.1 ApaG domain and Hemimethylated DNA-binding domain-containing protein [Strongyloides ratti]